MPTTTTMTASTVKTAAAPHMESAASAAMEGAATAGVETTAGAAVKSTTHPRTAAVNHRASRPHMKPASAVMKRGAIMKHGASPDMTDVKSTVAVKRKRATVKMIKVGVREPAPAVSWEIPPKTETQPRPRIIVIGQ